METIKFQLTGIAPILQHNGELANPNNKWTKAIKEISGKRMKTEEDFEEMARLEFLGSLYMNGNGPCIPSFVLEATLIGKGGAARKEKMGRQAAAGLFVPDDYDLVYEGPRDANELWADGNFAFVAMVKIQQNKVARTRPIFKDWSAEVAVQFSPGIINEGDVIRWMDVAGAEVGLMDWRPRYGRFEAEVLD